MIVYRFYSAKKPTSKEIKEINYLLHLLDKTARRITAADLLKTSRRAKLLLARNKATDEIVGMATLVTVKLLTAHYGRIEDVVVHNQYWGKSIGKTLIKKLIAEAKKLKLVRIDLTSNPKRIIANQMYQTLGFKQYNTNVYRLILKL